MRKINYHVSKSLQSISVMAYTMSEDGKHYLDPSCCDASNILGHWYLNRVKVHETRKGQGIGKQLVTLLQEALIERWQLEQDSPQDHYLIVEPGGYGSDVYELEKFYASCGFVKTIDHPELTMRWEAAK